MKTASFKLSILDNPAFSKFTKTTEEQNLGDPATAFLKAVEGFVNCEILHRRSERAKTLDLPKADYYENMAILHNTQGLRRLKSARASIKKAIKNLPPGLVKKVSEKEMKEILSEHEMIFKNELFEQDLSAVETAEIWTEYGKARNIVESKGAKGLLKHISLQIDELTGARTDLKKGRQHASPIAWWKYLAIVALVGVGIFTVIACCWFSTCLWWPYLAVAGIEFIRQLLESGC